MDIADAATNEAVKSTLMESQGIKDVLFVSCKQSSSIKYKVCITNNYLVVFLFLWS